MKLIDSRPRGSRSAVSRGTGLLALTLAGALLATACGSSDSEDKAEPAPASAGASDSGGDGVAAAQANSAKYADEPTQINAGPALSKKPPQKSVAFIVCADPTCATLAGFMKDATEALGWKLTTVNASATDPGAAIQQAIDAKVDYIAETGVDTAQFKPQMANAKAAGIPIFQCYATDVPAGESNNIFSNCYDSSSAEQYASALADWIIADSGGKAKVVGVDLPAFPILTSATTSAGKAMEQCSGCSFEPLALTVADLTGGKSSTAIVSYLQRNPDVNYVYLAFGGFSTGLSQALKGAGLADKVKVVGQQANQPQLEDIIDGNSAAWTALPQEVAMWVLADQMARVSVDEWTPDNERTSAKAPFFIVTEKAQAEDLKAQKAGWPGPDGFQDAYKELWGV